MTLLTLPNLDLIKKLRKWIEFGDVEQMFIIGPTGEAGFVS